MKYFFLFLNTFALQKTWSQNEKLFVKERFLEIQRTFRKDQSETVAKLPLAQSSQIEYFSAGKKRATLTLNCRLNAPSGLDVNTIDVQVEDVGGIRFYPLSRGFIKWMSFQFVEIPEGFVSLVFHVKAHVRDMFLPFVAKLPHLEGEAFLTLSVLNESQVTNVEIGLEPPAWNQRILRINLRKL